jgi:hypothetical protein
VTNFWPSKDVADRKQAPGQPQDRLRSGPPWSPAEQHFNDSGEDEEGAQHVEQPVKLLISAAPAAIMTPRMTIAPMMPQKSTRC